MFLWAIKQSAVQWNPCLCLTEHGTKIIAYLSTNYAYHLRIASIFSWIVQAGALCVRHFHAWQWYWSVMQKFIAPLSLKAFNCVTHAWRELLWLVNSQRSAAAWRGVFCYGFQRHAVAALMPFRIILMCLCKILYEAHDTIPDTILPVHFGSGEWGFIIRSIIFRSHLVVCCCAGQFTLEFGLIPGSDLNLIIACTTPVSF